MSTLPLPKSRTELLSSWGLAGCLRLWIPNFTVLASPLYQATRGGLSDPLELKSSVRSAFNTLKQALLSAPALTLPDLSHPFILCTERHKIAPGVLGRNQGPSFAPVAYLSRQLASTIRGRPACPRALAAGALLAQESKKLTFGAPAVIRSLRDFKDLLSHKSMTLLAPSHIQLIHVTLLEPPEFSFERCPTLNPATLIPHSSEPHIHTCKEALEDLTPHFSHISPTPLNNPDFTWYIDGSSSTTSEGKKVAGCAIVSDTEITESQPLPSGSSSPKAELIALTRPLSLQLTREQTYTLILNILSTSYTHMRPFGSVR